MTSRAAAEFLGMLWPYWERMPEAEESFTPTLLQEDSRDTEEEGCGTPDILTPRQLSLRWEQTGLLELGYRLSPKGSRTESLVLSAHAKR